jgi:chromosomal replication initiator protein
VAVVERGGGSIKRLDRLARKVYAFAGLTGEPVTEAFLDKHLAEIAGPIDPAARRRDIIFETIGDHFGVDRDALLSKRKTQALAVPRAIAVILLREHGGYTFKDIGALLGERSHTSVYLMFKKYGPEIAQNPTLASLAQEIGRRLVFVN